MTDLTLYVDGYFASPYDACCYIALTEKGLEFAVARALLRDGQGVPAGLQSLSTIGRVPSLRHGDFYLSESTAIVEYLDDVFPEPPVLPREPRARARARQLQAYLRFDLDHFRSERPWWTTLWPAMLAPLSREAAREARELVEVAARFLAVPEFEPWSMAHADLALALRRLVPIELPAAVQRFYDAEIARPSVRAYLDHPRPPHPPP